MKKEINVSKKFSSLLFKGVGCCLISTMFLMIVFYIISKDIDFIELLTTLRNSNWTINLFYLILTFLFLFLSNLLSLIAFIFNLSSDSEKKK